MELSSPVETIREPAVRAPVAPPRATQAPVAPRPRLAVAVESILARASNVAWPWIARLNHFLPGVPFQPKWAPAPLQSSKKRSYPTIDFPRTTDSLCPRCVKEARDAVLSGERDVRALVDDRPGEIKADILERDGKVLMIKECPRHGRFEDVLSIDPAFLRRIESLHSGRDFLAPVSKLRDHGTSSVKYGRGAVLTVDLTNRCNMMCDPCFMDANQVGYVHELEWADIKQILDDSLLVRPRRQMSIQFSGGEPTLSPHFFDAVRYAREVGYFAVQCATNGVRFAEDPLFAKAAKEAGLRMAYLQFDGVTNDAHAHRKVGNLFDVKVRAIENLHAAGIDVILVVTVVNGLNNDQIGPIVDFAIENADKITVVSFQPVSFTGRDEDVDDARRARERYTLSHLAHDVHEQLGHVEPMRDWFPLSALGPFADVTDLVLGPQAEFGAVNCGCHPDCGIGTVLFVNKDTKQMVPLTKFLDLQQLLTDLRDVADAAHGRALTMAEVSVALLRNFKPEHAPPGYGFLDLVKQFLSQTGARGERVGAHESDAREFPWRVLFVAGMWFQDLFTYDFRRTEMCIIPYGTQLGEISFCAYNTGIGFRAVVEKMKATATVAEWNETRGRHPVYAKGQSLQISPALGTVTLPPSALRKEEEAKRKRRLPLV